MLLYYTFFVVVMDCTQTLKFRRNFWRSESELEPLSGALPSPGGCRHLSRLFGEPERGLCFGDQRFGEPERGLCFVEQRGQIPPGNLNLHESQNLNLHESRHLAENTAPALPASQALDARDARQVEITILTTL